MEKPGIKILRSLDDLAPPDCEVCQLLLSLGVVFNIVELIKLEFSVKALKGYIGTFTISASYLLLVACCVDLVSYACVLADLTLTHCASHAYMVLNAEKRNKLVELVAHCKAALADAGTSTPAGPPPAATSTLITPKPAPIDHRQKGLR